MKKILFVITLLLISISNVNAEPCDAYDIKRLKEIAEGVEITYELLPPVEYEGDITIRDNYKIKISGFQEDIIVVNEKENKVYDSTSDYNEIIDGGVKQYRIKSRSCSQILRTVVLKLPVYNNFSEHEYCKEKKYKDLVVCQEWVENSVSEREFNDAIVEINQMDSENNSVNWLKENKIILIITIVFLFVLIGIVLVLKRKKEVLV